MPKYRMRPGFKHYHMGVKYEGAPPGRKGEHPDVLELDEDRAERLKDKMDLVGGHTDPQRKVEELVEKEVKEAEPEREPPDTSSSVQAGAEDKEQAPEDSEKEDKESPDSESEKSDPPVDESPALSLKYLGDGKWNVMRGDKPVNDVPLDEASAKALVDGGN